MKDSPYTIHYVEVNADEVARYYLKDYEEKSPEKIVFREWFHDPTKNKFIFRLTCSNKKESGV